MNAKKFIDKNKKGLILLLLIIISVFLAKTFFGRTVPYMTGEKKKKEVEGKEISIMSYVSAGTNDVDLGGFEQKKDLIPGAYAKRTLLLFKYTNYADVYKDDFNTNIYLEGNLLQSDNLSFLYNSDVYELVVIDNAYDDEDIQKIEIKNKSISDDEYLEINKINKKWGEEVLSASPLFLIDNDKYIQIPNEEASSLVLLALNNNSQITIEDLSLVDNLSGKKINGVSFALLDINGNDWNGGIKPIYIKVNTTKDIDFSKTSLKIKSTVLN